jgi:hypothetical protein
MRRRIHASYMRRRINEDLVLQVSKDPRLLVWRVVANVLLMCCSCVA